MADGGGFEVVHDSLDSHAAALDGFTDRLRTAVAAAKQVTMADDAYGIICRPFAWLVKPSETKGIDALQGAVDAMDATASGVRATSQTYQNVESGNAASFQSSD